MVEQDFTIKPIQLRFGVAERVLFTVKFNCLVRRAHFTQLEALDRPPDISWPAIPGRVDAVFFPSHPVSLSID